MNNDDLYIKLKYGYPLTAKSYREMPDELVDIIYDTLIPNNSLSGANIKRLFIGIDILGGDMIGNRWESSAEICKIIQQYHEKHG